MGPGRIPEHAYMYGPKGRRDLVRPRNQWVKTEQDILLVPEVKKMMMNNVFGSM
jgi:hypothetical protein